MKFKVNGWHLNPVEEAPCGWKVNSRQISAIDELTGLANYQGLSETVESEIIRSKRSGRDFAVLLFNLNEMRQINDGYGHPARDRALCRLAHIFRFYCRIIDTAARYGDDEIVIILPESGTQAADTVERRVCERLFADCEEPLLSVSVGIAVYPGDGKTLDALFEAAIRAVYNKKQRSEESVTHSGSLPYVISERKRILVPSEDEPLAYAEIARMAK
jgi:diguanylate cyclase (GGDEF)-like protein